MRKILYILLLFLPYQGFSQINLTIEGKDTIVGNAGGYDIPRDAPTNLIFRNNRVTVNLADGYILQCGDDLLGVNANNLDSALISGNYFKDGQRALHGLMAGYSNNYHMKYNYLDSCHYGIVHEGGYNNGDSMINTGGGFHHNIFENAQMGINTKGFDGTEIYNNTFYTTSTSFALFSIQIKESDTGGLDTLAHSSNTKVKNNIFYSTSTTQHAIRVEDTVGFESDYNLYYYVNKTNYEPLFQFLGVTKTWSQWRALGYDTHSVIVNPNFVDIINFAPSVSLDYGVSLGAEFAYGLSSSAVWTAGSYPDTVQQGAVWQVGAVTLGGGEPLEDIGTWYVGPNGNDSNTGNDPNSPWKTWGKAFNDVSVTPGDTVYFLNGVHYKNTTTEASYFRGSGYGYAITREGTAGNYVNYWAYPGHTPILDCDSARYVDGGAYGINSALTDYCHFKGLTIRNVWQSEDGRETDLTTSGNLVIGYDYKVTAGSIVHNSITYNAGEWFRAVATTYTGTGTVYRIVSSEAIGWKEYNSIKNIYENCKVYNVHGIGFQTSGYDSVLYLNCDAYMCCDSFALAPAFTGNRGSGFSVEHNTGYTDTAIVRNCRAWLCGDQGFTARSESFVLWDGNWSMYNGLMLGGGHGLKLSLNTTVITAVRRKMVNNILCFNRQSGITTNDNEALAMNIYNNITYHNGYYPDDPGYWGTGGQTFQAGIIIYNSDSDQTQEERRIFRNNISFDNENGVNLNLRTGAFYTHSNNTWDGGGTVTSADFQGPLDSATISAVLLGARQADGSLPIITNFYLAEGSDLVNAGIDVGLPYNETAPDIGPFESAPPLPPPGQGGYRGTSGNGDGSFSSGDGKILLFRPK